MKSVLPIVGIMSALASMVALSATPADRDLDGFLRHDLGLSHADVRDVNGRRAASRSLATSDGREVATAGAVQLAVPPAFYIQQLQDIVGFKRSPAVLQIGTFGTPARLADVAGLTLPRGDVDGLRRCRPHDCNIQLSETAIRRFQQDVDWHAADAADQADRLFRQLLVDLVNGYRARGSAALMDYHDRRQPVSTADEFEALVADGPAFLRRHPMFIRHVLHYPARSVSAPGTTDVIYWSREKVGPSEVVSVTHMAFSPMDTPPVVFAVASKQIYGSRYFDASLGLTLLLRDASMDDNATCLVYVNLSRVNALRGFLGGIKRTIVRARTRSTMTDYLELARDMVERRFAERRQDPGRDATIVSR